jgi:glucose 1-dehydrogenase
LLRASLTHLGYLGYHNPRPEKDAAVTSFGRLDIIVNNAGTGMHTSVLDTTENRYDGVLAINLKSAFFGTQLAAK